MEMEIIQCYQTKNPCYRKGTPMKPVGIRGAQHGGEQSAPVPVCGLSRTAGGEPVRQPLEPAGGGDAGAWSHRTGQGWGCDGGEHPPYTWRVGRGQGEPGSYNYDPTGAHSVEMCEDDLTDPSYFDQVMETAVAYCARLCREYGLAAESVVSHKEAHAQGYASNHGDPENWMGRFGMTMEDFRARVRAKLKGEVTIMGKVVNRDELVAWIDAHAVEVEEQPEPEVKPEPLPSKPATRWCSKAA